MTAISHRRSLYGLYVILDPSVSPYRPLHDVLALSARAGARIFQYRNKAASMKEAYAEAFLLRKVASDMGVLFIVNDRCDVALAVDADGVHLGQDDLPYTDARRLLGPGKLIGVSTHRADQVKAAAGLRPDYLGFGPIFTPGSKRDHDPVVGLEGLREVRPLTTLPIFAIGGIQVEHVQDVLHAGANGVAVVSAILKAPDIGEVVRDFLIRMSSPASPAS